jgi:26S proteasome regulatory subunit N3
MGRINALQLDYSDAFTKLTQSARKAPQNAALEFRVVCAKLTIIVQLLLGEVPERSVFNTVGMQKALLPYFQLTQTVRLGNLLEFNRTVEQHMATFQVRSELFLTLSPCPSLASHQPSALTCRRIARTR